MQSMNSKQVAAEGISLIESGSIRNHLLASTAGEHSGEAEVLEAQRFADFLPTKNGCMVFELTGSDNLD